MLTIEQRAQRATKKINKLIAARYPLLADQLAVSVESQIDRLEKQHRSNDEFFVRLSFSNDQAWTRAHERKDVAKQYLSSELFSDYESRYERIYGKHEYQYAGSSAADWWWCALRDNSIPWAFEHCPNNHLHEDDWHRKIGRCPTCHKPLEPIHIIPAINQIVLFG